MLTLPVDMLQVYDRVLPPAGCVERSCQDIRKSVAGRPQNIDAQSMLGGV